jgi:hypothetical protein
MSEHGHHDETIRFTIDGKLYTATEDDEQAAGLLRLAGLDPNLYDLAKVRPGGNPEVLEDSTVVELENGDQFVSVRENATVA